MSWGLQETNQGRVGREPWRRQRTVAGEPWGPGMAGEGTEELAAPTEGLGLTAGPGAAQGGKERRAGQ